MAVQLNSVLICDPVDPLATQILQQNGIRVVNRTKLSPNELITELQNHDGLIVRSESRVTADILAQCPNLKVVGRAGTGVDNIDCKAATRHGVIVVNTPGGNTLSAAEHTCAMMMTLTRNIASATASLKSGQWNKKAFMGQEINGKTLAVLGLGRIGKEVAVRMQGFGMEVIGFDPIVTKEDAKAAGIEKLELDEIWPRADFITVHTPLIPQTKNLINDETLSKCKKGIRIVNVARGGIVDEEALLRALESGHCAGAALDVFVEEPPKKQWYFEKLFAHTNVVCTPHLGASTREAQQRVAQEIAEEFVDLSQGRPVAGIINAPSITRASGEANRPWLQLAQALGKISAGTAELAGGAGKKTTVRVITYGKSLEQSNFLGAGVLVGQMSAMTHNGVNLVNAPLLAQEAGFQVETIHENEVPKRIPSQQAMKVEVTIAGVTHYLLGIVTGVSPVLLEMDNVKFEGGVTLDGNLLLFTGEDVPTALANLIGGLAAENASLTSLIRSSTISGSQPSNKAWYIARTAQTLSSASQLKIQGLRLASQCQF